MVGGLEKKVFMICPVRIITKEVYQILQKYKMELEQRGYRVHFPPDDTNQLDPVGLAICSQNRAAIRDADEIHIYWNPGSEGSRFDLGMAFMLEKPIRIINRDDVQRTPHKSFQNVLLELDAKYGL